MTIHSRKLTGLVPLLIIITVILVSYATFGSAFAQSIPEEGQPVLQAQGSETPLPLPTRTPIPSLTYTLFPTEAVKSLATPTAYNQEASTQNSPNVPLVLGTNTPLPNVSTFSGNAVFSFRDVGVQTFTLHFPDLYTFDLNMPDRWQISPSTSFLEVHYNLVEDFGAKLATVSPFGKYRYGTDRPNIEIYVDQLLAGTIPPEVGDHVAKIKLPYSVAETLRYDPTNSHSVEFRYYQGGGGADMYCDYEGAITILEASTINLSFSDVPPTLNLANFPSPLIQDSFIPEILYLVIPSDTNESDLTLVSRLSTSIGRRAPYANLKLEVVTASEVNPAMLSKSSAIFIGTPQRNAYLAKLFKANAFVTQISNDGQTIMGITGNEGLLQLAKSDVNPNNVYMAITGNTEEGVTKALSELTFPPIGLGGPFFISRTGYVPSYNPTPMPDTFRLSDLGYRERPFYGLGLQQRSFNFYIPRDWEIQDGARFILTFAHANNLSYSNSGVTVLINNSPAGTIPMASTDIGEKKYSFPIAKDALIPGALNVISFQATLQRELDCSQFEARVTWFNIRDSSIVYIPHKIITEERFLPPMQDPIFYLSNEPRILFVMAPQPSPMEINGLANLSRVIGSQMLSPNFDVTVSINPELDTSLYKTHHFVAIGLPTRNTFIQSINDQLPQPFVPGENSLTLQQKIGSYRIEQTIGIGLAEVIEAPWAKRQGVTVITGTSDDGLKWVVDRISNVNFIYNFSGEVNFVQADRVESYQTGIPLHVNLASVVAELTGQKASMEAVQPTQQAAPGTPNTGPAESGGAIDKFKAQTPMEQPRIGIYLILGLVVIGVIVVVLGINRTIRGGRKR